MSRLYRCVEYCFIVCPPSAALTGKAAHVGGCMRTQRVKVSDGVESELLLHVSLRNLAERLRVVFQQLEDGGQLLTLHPG